jgi:hypothetical protein
LESEVSYQDGFLTIGVGQGELAVVVEPAEPVGELGLGGFGLVEPERSVLGVWG